MTDATIAAPPKRDWKQNRLARIVIMFLSLLALYAVGQALGVLASQKLPAPYQSDGLWAAALFGSAIALGGYVLLVRWMERRKPIAELAPRDAPGGLIAGAILGVFILSAVLGIMYAMGAASFAYAGPFAFPVAATTVAIISGVVEELMFRGVLFRIVEDGFGSLVALAISGALFGGLHITNPHATLVSSAAIAIEAGPLFGAAYMATRRLWLPIGLHFGWNFTEGGVYSTMVSGTTAHGVIKTTLVGPDLLTGGSFGPEASWITVVVCSVLTAIFLVIAVRRGQWKPVQFHIRAP
jgi:hypothetical protein